MSTSSLATEDRRPEATGDGGGARKSESMWRDDSGELAMDVIGRLSGITQRHLIFDQKTVVNQVFSDKKCVRICVVI